MLKFPGWTWSTVGGLGFLRNTCPAVCREVCVTHLLSNRKREPLGLYTVTSKTCLSSLHLGKPWAWLVEFALSFWSVLGGMTVTALALTLLKTQEDWDYMRVIIRGLDSELEGQGYSSSFVSDAWHVHGWVLFSVSWLWYGRVGGNCHNPSSLWDSTSLWRAIMNGSWGLSCHTLW